MTERFSADWLALRAPADRRARNPAVADAAAAWAAGLGRAPTVVDLGCGSGANLDCLAPVLPVGQVWHLVDHDRDLLDRAVARAGDQPAVSVATPVATDLSAALPLDLIGAADLVTAAALLDLVSAAWLDRLLSACRAAGTAVCFVLTVDGTVTWWPPDPDDETVAAAVRRHQACDKGFGPALGGDAVARLRRATEGWARAVAGASPWRLGAADAALQTALIDGYAVAAAEVIAEGDPADLLAIRTVDAWAVRRRRAIAAGHGGLTVGHCDVFACPSFAIP